jgi:hypothetical protein
MRFNATNKDHLSAACYQLTHQLITIAAAEAYLTERGIMEESGERWDSSTELLLFCGQDRNTQNFGCLNQCLNVLHNLGVFSYRAYDFLLNINH